MCCVFVYFIVAWILVSHGCFRIINKEDKMQCFENLLPNENETTLFQIGILLTSWVSSIVQEISISLFPPLCLVRKFYSKPDDFNVYFDSRLWYKSQICTNSTQEFLCQGHPVHNMIECDKTQYSCPGGSCIRTDYVCDGKDDCLDGVEEHNCTNICTEGIEIACQTLEMPTLPKKT